MPIAIGAGFVIIFVAAGTYFLKSSTRLPQSVSEFVPSEQAATAADDRTDNRITTVFNTVPLVVDEASPTPTLEPVVPTPSPTTAPTQSTPAWEGERFPETRTRYLSQADIQSWSYAKVRYALNEIYARHGYRFQSAPIRQQFQKFNWYNPVQGRAQSVIENSLGSTEKANMLLLAQRRNELQNDGTRSGE